MNSDQELSVGIKRLNEIAFSHSKGEHNNEEIQEALDILLKISIYAGKMSNERSVQISQIDENISDIRHVLNQPAVEGHYPRISHYIDNLVTYCGAKI